MLHGSEARSMKEVKEPVCQDVMSTCRPWQQASMPHCQNARLSTNMAFGYKPWLLTADLEKPFRQCPLTWWIFVTIFILIARHRVKSLGISRLSWRRINTYFIFYKFYYKTMTREANHQKNVKQNTNKTRCLAACSRLVWSRLRAKYRWQRMTTGGMPISRAICSCFNEILAAHSAWKHFTSAYSVWNCAGVKVSRNAVAWPGNLSMGHSGCKIIGPGCTFLGLAS